MSENTRPGFAPEAVSEEALRWIVRLNSGTATAEDFAAYAAWRDAHPNHKAAAAEAEKIWNDAADIHLDARTGTIRPGRPQPKVSRRSVVAGGLALVTVGGGTIWSERMLRRPSADYVTQTAETRIIDLPDGSRMHLGARSAANLAFSTAQRSIEVVEGRAFFDVAADGRPFDVRIGDVTVTALGTKFDINAALPAGAIEIAVTEHAVRVTQARMSSTEVAEGHALRFDGAGAAAGVHKVDSASIAAWRDGLYIAEERPLEEVVAALAAYQSGWIVVQSPRLAQMRVNAVLDLGQPSAALASLGTALSVHVRQFSPFLTVISEI